MALAFIRGHDHPIGNVERLYTSPLESAMSMLFDGPAEAVFTSQLKTVELNYPLPQSIANSTQIMGLFVMLR